jgi:hypothetical protein
MGPIKTPSTTFRLIRGPTSGPISLFQTVSPRTSVNKGKKRTWAATLAAAPDNPPVRDGVLLRKGGIGQQFRELFAR